MILVECPGGHRWEVEDDGKSMDSDIFNQPCPECGLNAKYVV